MSYATRYFDMRGQMHALMAHTALRKAAASTAKAIGNVPKLRHSYERACWGQRWGRDTPLYRLAAKCAAMPATPTHL